MITVEIVREIRGEGMRESREAGNSSMIRLVYCRNLSKFYNITTPSPTIKDI
jgi:hypothetical protein